MVHKRVVLPNLGYIALLLLPSLVYVPCARIWAFTTRFSHIGTRLIEFCSKVAGPDTTGIGYSVFLFKI